MTHDRLRESVSAAPHDVAQIVASCNLFATALYSQLAAASPGNLFLSPSNLALALAMTYAGANGETAREIADVLRFTLPSDRIHEAFRRLQESTRTGGVELRLANRLWGQADYRFLPDFLQTTEQCYGARFAEEDFRGDAEAVRLKINRWVAEQTAGKIGDLLSPGSLTHLTRLVLTSAIYFLGAWESEFDADATTDAPFWTAAGNQTTPIMRQRAHLRYGEFDDLQVLEMAYRRWAISLSDDEVDGIKFTQCAADAAGGSDLAMCILLPKQADGLQAIENQLSTATLQRWTTLRPHDVVAHIPKFRIASSFYLHDTLASMGMRKAFSENEADFSGMSDDPEGLFIGTVVHKAVVDVNEQGTEAAAATATALRGGCAMPEEPKTFRADHPFLFLIRDRTTRLIHFIGRVTNPAAD